MKSSALHLMLSIMLLGAAASVQASDNGFARPAAQTRDVVIPAGTLMTCTLDEPKFSSATVSVGDPFLCHPRAMQAFGQIVFPRGTYIVGHLEDDKEPGHFVGKGYLKLAFDRIGLPDGDIPLTAKMVAVAGFNVNKQGKVIGHGHATRDVVEWMLPPLWPWKVLTLPARGPRPTLKGETHVTLRVMDDLIIPRAVKESALPPIPATPSWQPTRPGWRHFGEKPSALESPATEAAPQLPQMITARYQAVPIVEAVVQSPGEPQMQEAAVIVKETPVKETPAVMPAAAAPPQPWAPSMTLFALADGSVFAASQYWRDQEKLCYLSGRDKVSIALNEIDWSATLKLNAARNVRVVLRNAPVVTQN
jgi:hypothetical protein